MRSTPSLRRLVSSHQFSFNLKNSIAFNSTHTQHSRRVVEQARVPHVMSATTPIMEVAGIGSIKLVEAIHNVLAGVTVNHVQQNGDAMRVGHVHQLLQFFWCSIATASAQKMLLVK